MNYLILVTNYSCFSPCYELVCWEIYLLYLPVLAVRTLERFLRFVDSKVALQVGFTCEFLGADRALEQDFSRHVNHLDVHFQNVLVLYKQHTNLSFSECTGPTQTTHKSLMFSMYWSYTNNTQISHFQNVLVLHKQHTNLSFSECTGPTQTTHKSLIFSMYWSYTNNTQISHFQYVLVLHKQHTNLSFPVCTGPTQTTHKSLIYSMYWSYTNNTQISHFQNVLVLHKQHTNLSFSECTGPTQTTHKSLIFSMYWSYTNNTQISHFQYVLVLHKQHTNLSFTVCTGPTQTTHKSLPALLVDTTTRSLSTTENVCNAFTTTVRLNWYDSINQSRNQPADQSNWTNQSTNNGNGCSSLSHTIF